MAEGKMKKYDVAIIGSGVGGQKAARVLKDGKKDVVLIEEDLWGGTCPNRGCEPKKVLVAGMEAVNCNNQLIGKGLSPIRSINWPELLAFKRALIDPLPERFKKQARDYGIETLDGSAVFSGNNQISVNGKIIEADKFIIATGQRPHVLDIKGSRFLKTSTDFFEMQTLPRKIIFLGAGYIAFELASIANAAGSEVTIIHHNSRPLKSYDEDLVSALVNTMKEKGTHFVFDVEIQAVHKTEKGLLLTEKNGRAWETDDVVCATGRVPNMEKLGLEKAGIAFDQHGIIVNKYLQTSNPSVFACGDVVGKKQPKLTPVAEFEGNYVAKKILNDSLKGISYPPITSIVFASPKLAEVGIKVNDAKKQPDQYLIKETDMTGWFNYRRVNDRIARAKFVFKDEKLVGASVLSGQADELINNLAIIIDRGITHEQVQQMILGYPSIASDLSELV
jgi:glutathione reductase (NADPH)